MCVLLYRSHLFYRTGGLPAGEIVFLLHPDTACKKTGFIAKLTYFRRLEMVDDLIEDD